MSIEKTIQKTLKFIQINDSHSPYYREKKAEMAEYDGIIIGTGPNGLLTASYLAKAGLKIQLLEERSFEMRGGSEDDRRPLCRDHIDSTAHHRGSVKNFRRGQLGPGESVAWGEITPDSFVIDKQNGKIVSNRVPKPRLIRPSIHLSSNIRCGPLKSITPWTPSRILALTGPIEILFNMKEMIKGF